MPRSLCCRIRKDFDGTVVGGENHDEVSVQRKPRKRRRDSIRTPEFVEELQYAIDEDPGKSMQCLAQELNMCEGAVQKCVHIRHKPYALQRH